jgi:lysophospholipase L1-like esterase
MTIRLERKGTLLHFILAAAVLLAITLTVFLAAITRATDISWAGSSDPTLTYETKTPPNLSAPRIFGCTDQKIAVDGYFSSVDACVTTGKSIKLAIYHNPTTGNDYLAISYLSDTSFYKITNISLASYSFHPVLLPGTDTLYTMWPNGSLARSLSIYKPFTSKLTKTLSIIDHTEYMWDTEAPDFALKDENDTKINLNAVANSPDGRWIVTEARGRGLARIDTNDLSAKAISGYYRSYGVGNDPVMSIAVTDDGQHVAVGGMNVGFAAIDVPDSCGDPVTNANFNSSGTIPHPCPHRDYYGFINARAGDPNKLTWAQDLNFSDDGGQLTFYFSPTSEQHFVTMTASGYVPAPRLDYLAMGDSYSSGEGDLGVKSDGTSYYTPLTNYKDGCHLSERSYPFRLQTYYNFSSEKMKSIACAGAETKDIILSGGGYPGQGERLRNLSELERATEQNTALNVFNSGYVEQVRFVKHYKPKAVTLTIGGNDVGFRNIVRECATSFFTCSQAEETNLRGQIGQTIKESFGSIKTMLENIQSTSPDTKIFLLSYPQFIYDGTAVCGPNVGLTDSDERVMMSEGVKYMNKIIEAAARATGVVYVDIENSLTGGRMCELGGYVTGTMDVRFDSSLYPSTFHPNAKGHAKMADTIQQQLGDNTLLTYPYNESHGTPNVDPTPYFASSMASYNKSARYSTIISAPLVRGQTTQAKGEARQVEPNSTIITSGFSDHVDLGSFVATSDGSINTTITIPATMPVGFHTLVFSGKSYSGEPIDIYQVIEVQGANPNDRDEDGFPDTSDPCLYIPAANVDADSDGIDDACDPEIGEPKEAYRIRGGVVANSEQANYLYIERNVNATTLTGISGDYDPDHDGWAVVAASQNTTQAGPYAKFWIDGNNGNKVPHVSLRTAENGCVQYKSANLTKIINSSSRAFTQEAADTNTCRSEPATADVDNNGQPDNTQPLYRARNGITANGEDSRKLYLERSARAAEAQLGKSDYAANDTPPTGPMDTVDHRKAWSRLATSSPGLIVDTYKKLVFINNQPYVLAANFLNQCYAYKSQSLATIKQSTQATRQLQIDWVQTLNVQLQGGCN